MITRSRFRLFRGSAAVAILVLPCSCRMVNGKESELSRFFSSYPGGLPGLGLLLLRSAVGLIAVLQGVIFLAKADGAAFGARAVGAFALLGGTLFVFGLWSRWIGIALGLGIAALWWSAITLSVSNLFDRALTALLAETISIAAVLLGPGAFSLDARLFGRREITIPPRPRSS